MAPGPNGSYEADLVVVASKSAISPHLHRIIIKACKSALSARSSFVIALGGGSIPSFLSALNLSFDAYCHDGIGPQYNKWHVLLVDERGSGTPEAGDGLSDSSSSLGSSSSSIGSRRHFLDKVPIPPSQVYRIDQSLLDSLVGADGKAMSQKSAALRAALIHGDGKIDCAVLGFGPDGSLREEGGGGGGGSIVIPTDDAAASAATPLKSAFDPPMLSSLVRSAIICGAGASRGHVVKAVLGGVGAVAGDDGSRLSRTYRAFVAETASRYPCGTVRPEGLGVLFKPPLVWIVDEEAAKMSLSTCDHFLVGEVLEL